MRHCIRCNQWKDESEFNLRNIQGAKLQYVCRTCQQEQGRERYANMTERVKEINNQARLKSKGAAVLFIQEFLIQNPCTDCGETDITVLTFDHVRGDKKNDISNMVQHAYGIETIRKELDKCEVVCFNCHMRREQKRRGSWRFGL